MKKNLYFFLTLFFLFLTYLSTTAQTSFQGMNYQAVARNASGGVVASEAIKVRFNILTGSATGIVRYSEVQTTTTTAQGLFTLVIGKGVPQTGTFASIDWSTANHYLQTEIDVTGGNNFVSIGTTPLYSVPFALYAANNMVGPPGPQGATGAIGPTGPQGAAGNTWSINSTVFNSNGTLTVNTNIPSTITSTNSTWLARGNQGTSPASDFIGTTDAQPLVIKTGGTAAINERIRFSNNPGIVINGVTSLPGRLFTVYGTGHPSAITIISRSVGQTGNNAAIYGENNGVHLCLGVFTGVAGLGGESDALAPVAGKRADAGSGMGICYFFFRDYGVRITYGYIRRRWHWWHWWLGWTL
jgi:hypothetical protein